MYTIYYLYTYNICIVPKSNAAIANITQFTYSYLILTHSLPVSSSNTRSQTSTWDLCLYNNITTSKTKKYLKQFR